MQHTYRKVCLADFFLYKHKMLWSCIFSRFSCKVLWYL